MRDIHWLCLDCATMIGGKLKEDHISSWHTGNCDACKKIKEVTAPRDFGLRGLTRK